MGYLHKGHMSLVERARKECDIVIVSIYVNPTQFGPNEDLEKYPRDFERDSKLCEEAGTDVIFFPSNEEMYPKRYLTFIEVKGLSKKLCGITRPNHFKGVTTIVAKLLNIIMPDKAYFGLKDYQQYIIVKKMVEDLNMNVEVIGCPTIREENGLAMSSRNSYLNPKEREEATILYKSLKHVKKLLSNGETNPEKIKTEIIDKINKTDGKIDYVEIVNGKTLDQIKKISKGDVIALAVFFGKTRLIDNVML
jgi:pantoate--beta-alanine ligase